MPLAAGWTLAILVAVGFSALGVWQYGRAEQKRALLAQVQHTLQARQPVPLSVAAQDARVDGIDWAAGQGRFADGPAVLLDNQVRDGQPGVRVYRPFLPANGGPALLVELGWQPLRGDRALPVIAPLPGSRQISGLLVAPPSPGLIRGAAVAQGDGDLLVVALQPATLAAALKLKTLAPRVLKLDPALPIGYPRDLDVLPNTLPPERHLGYAVQWFGLALAVLATAAVLTWRRRGAAREKMGA
ncbi:Cytochrome oxidase assembly protein ShyY1 [Pseudoxanthomonas sp. GM95]|uniref:SURF1 family protein n=1 Tax=Pseudoxanthomonas sp. GM95 TaxID=1881043 RepID=UPI0008D7EF95|nr:SURF1 family protein [Pseudoxanthomonas sp. GM95]SEM13199.1 Cytochrome oxidase assembly protein ShyY1 [Pseudoxanthomonas sp. GM95]